MGIKKKMNPKLWGQFNTASIKSGSKGSLVDTTCCGLLAKMLCYNLPILDGQGSYVVFKYWNQNYPNVWSTSNLSYQYQLWGVPIFLDFSFSEKYFAEKARMSGGFARMTALVYSLRIAGKSRWTWICSELQMRFGSMGFAAGTRKKKENTVFNLIHIN